jgi:hypothetical protein
MRELLTNVLRAVLLTLIAVVVVQLKTPIVHAESECTVMNCHLWYGDPCTECPVSGGQWCSYFCWSCTNGDYGCN